MGKLSQKEIKKINTKNHKCFVETGTYDGRTTLVVNDLFSIVHTFEISEKLYNDTKEKATKLGKNNIVFHLGDTTKIFDDIVSKIKEPILFFLDAHKIFGSMNEHTPGGCGDIDVPLMNELKSIKNRNYDDIIIIDDVRLFGTNEKDQANWEEININKILEFFNDRIEKHQVNSDRLEIYLKRI